MNCPKCGNFVEDGKEYCFMCGTKVGSGDFSSPGNIRRNNTRYSREMMDEEFNRKKEEYNRNKNNYRDVEIKHLDNEKKDIFDIYSEHKNLIQVCIVVGIVLIAGLITLKIKSKEQEEKDKVPLVQDLYYEVSEEMKFTGNSNNQMVYNFTGDNSIGSDCSIIVATSSSVTGDHVTDLFNNVESNFAPKYDDNGDVLDAMSIPLYQSSDFVINNVKWHYINVLYKKNTSDSFTDLRYRFLTATKNGFFYDIQLTNNLNSSSVASTSSKCTYILDSFVRSLEFIEQKQTDKK